MNEKLLFVTCALFCAVTSARAASVACTDVVSLASVDYPPSMSVSVISDKSKKFCRFSINGYVADAKAPPEFKNLTSDFNNTSISALIASNTASTYKILTHLMFAADPAIDPNSINRFELFFKKNYSRIESCYVDASKGKEELNYDVKSDDFSFECIVKKGTRRIESRLEDTRTGVTRVSFIPIR